MKDYFEDVLNLIKTNQNHWKEILSGDPYNISVKPCPFTEGDEILYPDVYMLSYNQIFSDFSTDIVKGCRGSIIDVEDPSNPKMVCASFFKFFNHGEINVDEIDWNTAKVLEKVDGSLVKVFNFKGKWTWVTNNGWDINMEVPVILTSSFDEPETDNLKTFGALKDFALAKIMPEADFYAALDPEYTYMFELLSPKNRIVCDQPKTELVILGARHNDTHVELAYEDILPNLAFRRVRQYDLDSIEATLLFCDALVGSEDEGVVAVDANFNRFKIKGANYRELKGIKREFGCTKANLLIAIRAGTVDDILGAFPQYQLHVEELMALLKAYNAKVEEIRADARALYSGLRGAVDSDGEAKKKFAEIVIRDFSADKQYWFAAIKDNPFSLTRLVDKADIEEMNRVVEE